MNTVIIINLNGNAFHLEEPGYQSLRSYLEKAQAQLKDNPDRTEIMADLEQAIADKCAHFLQPHKNVLSAAEIEDIIKQMGPVQWDGEESSGGSAANQQAPAQPSMSDANTPRRLYQIREGAMFSGVCNGIAAYFKIDVTIVRILFVALTLLTSGAWLLVYIGMMLVIPFANTGEEHAAATGVPFNAKEVIDRARKQYSEFKDNKEWRRHWRQQRREWRRRWHEGAYWWGHNVQRNVYQISTGYGNQIIAGLLIPFLAILSAIVFCVWIVAIVSLATTGMIFGWAVADTMPLWVAVLLLIFIYSAIASPLRHARRAVYLHSGGYQYSFYAALDGILTLGVVALVCWLAYTHFSQVHDFFLHFNENWQTMWNNIVDSFRRTEFHKPPPGAEHTALVF